MDSNFIKVQSGFDLSSEEYESLIVLYQPLFAYPAMPLYLTLFQFSKISDKVCVDELKRTLQISLEESVQWRKELERFGLIRTFKGDVEEIMLVKPLAPFDFFQHSTYARLFSIVMGSKKFIDLSHRYRKEPLKNREEISESFDLNRLAIWDETLEQSFNKHDTGQTTVSYDVDGFFKRISIRLFPMELRTEATRGLISEMATMYQLNFSDLRAALFSATNFETKVFNEKKFRYSIERQFGTMKPDDVEDIYQLDPISFLKHIQGYDYVGTADKNLIQSLIKNFGFKSEVINVLIEYVLKSNDNNLVRAYVEKIASVWKRDKISTKEEALALIEKPVFEKSSGKNKTIKHHTAMPSYSEYIEIDEDVDGLQSEFEAFIKKG
ncbi:DnaD domain protein [Erysipelothrix urinaevulpis]|uniref:DnaD domain protein n=1 Tax=Erysipelothrix urinaevulpis TaxID=2683717 RepID=UPI00135C66B0|nr:DnaD domain protein [Erysipelothrix urinaevulpis]